MPAKLFRPVPMELRHPVAGTYLLVRVKLQEYTFIMVGEERISLEMGVCKGCAEEGS